MQFHVSSLDSIKRKAKHLTKMFDDVPLSLAHKAISEALGYKDWHELVKVSNQGHPASPLDDDVSETILKQRLQQQQSAFQKVLGIHFRDAETVYLEVSLTASPSLTKARLTDPKIGSPWGVVQEWEEISPGIIQVSTARHGGYHLSEEVLQRLPENFRKPNGWYEEDNEWCFFKSCLIEFADDRVEALLELKQNFPYDYEFLTGMPHDADLPHLSEMVEWANENPNSFYPISNWSSDVLLEENQPDLPQFFITSWLSSTDLLTAIKSKGKIGDVQFKWTASSLPMLPPIFEGSLSSFAFKSLDIEPILSRGTKFGIFSPYELSDMGSSHDHLIVSQDRLVDIGNMFIVQR